MERELTARAETSVHGLTRPRGVEVKMNVKGLSLSYADHLVLSDVDLQIHKGEVLAVIGPSGCGKSSFLQALNRLTDLIPSASVRGDVWLESTAILHPKTDVVTLRRRVGMIFQKPNPFPTSIRKNIEFPLKEHGVRSRQERSTMLQEVLEQVVLWDEVRDRLDRPAANLSGGQQQRLCIARALALKPEVLLLDEPCASLDPISTEKIEHLMARLRGELTMVLVTHNLSQARRVADRVAVFWNVDGTGRLIETGDPEQVFDNPSHPITARYVQGRAG